MQSCKLARDFILILWRKLSFSEKSSNMENVGFVKCELKEDMDEEEFVNYDNENNEENRYSCNKCEEVYFTNESLKQHLIEVHDTETHKGTVTRSILIKLWNIITMGIENMAFYEIFPPKFANLSVKLTLNFILTTNKMCFFLT